jgi:hypothetical protein
MTINITQRSVADMSIGKTVGSLVAELANAIICERLRVPIPEIEGANVSFSFSDAEKLCASYGPSWVLRIFGALDQTEPQMIRKLLEIGVSGCTVDHAVSVLPLDRLAETIATALILRIRGAR